MSSDDPSGPGHDDGSYAAAIDELEQILDELEGGNVDLDLLGTRLARAAELIARCRARIEDARVEVDHILSDLDAGRPSPSGRGPDQGSATD
jgi:exodeoxyribonuclease VII small subunit